MEINQLLAPIRDFELEPTKFDINKVLFDFQHQINAHIFYQLQVESDLNEYLRIIWKFLLKSSNHPSSNTRISACKAISTYLTWITPFFPENMRNSFIDVVNSQMEDTKNSAVIASSYAFLSTFIAEPFLADFIKSTQSFDQFIFNGVSSTEHSASIISKFSHFGSDFLTKLLNHFLHQIDEKQDRNLIRAISSILSNNPSFYFNIVLDFVKPQMQKFLSLITFLISNFHESIISKTDLMPVAITAIDTIADEKANLADIDSSFQILSIKSDSFNFSASSENETTCDMKIWNSKGEEKSATVDLKKVVSMPSFYSLKLPLNLLLPNKEKDSVLVLSAKFKSIASNEKFDMNEVLSIFEPFLKNEYNEISSSAIQALAICVNSILSIIPLKNIHAIIRKVLFTKPLNWYHSFDILKVISNVDSNLFREKMGENCFIEMLETLIDFCLCENESLAADSMKVLAEKEVIIKFDKIVDLVIKKCDFFEILKLDRCVSVLTVILKKFDFSDTKNEKLLFFSQKLIEATPLYYENINFICNVFTFFSIFKVNHEKNKGVINAAYHVIFSTIEIISDQSIKSSNKIESSAYFKDLIKNDLAFRNIDIITDSFNDPKSFIYPMRCALSFIFKNAPKNNAMITVLNSYRLLPFECSKFYEMNWENELNDTEKSQILSNLFPILISNSDERIHSTWCRICLMGNQKFETAKSKKVLEFLIKMASNFLSHFENDIKDASISDSYINFYYKFEKSEISIPVITNYLNKISDESLAAILKKTPKLLEIIPSIKSRKIELQNDKKENSESENENETTNLPDKIEDSQLPQLFEDAVRQSNVKVLKEIIKLMSDKKVSINLKTINIEFPPETVPIVSAYFANNLDTEDKEIDLIKALRESLTGWRPYSIELLKKSDNRNKLLSNLLSLEKVKKNDILCLCSLIGIIEFDNELLFELSTKLLFDSKKINRFRVTLKLFATVISIQTIKIPPTFLSSLSTTLSPAVDNIDTEGMSLALLLIAQKVGFPQELVKFADDIIARSGHRSTAHGRIIQIYIGISSSFQSVAQKINDFFTTLTITYLQSFLPSRFNLGSRLFEQSVLSIKPLSIGQFLARGIDIIVNRYNGITKYPSSVVSASKAILSFISRDGINQQQQVVLLRSLYKINVNSSDACFITFISILKFVLQRFPSNNDFMKKFPDSFFDSVFTTSGYNNGNPYKYAKLCLLERLKVIKSEISREKLIGNTAEQWIASLPNYNAVSQINDWWKIVERHFSLKKSFAVFDQILKKAVKSCGFGVAFPTILSIFVKYREKCGNLNEFKKLFNDMNEIIDKKCQREAFDEMKKLPTKAVEKEKYKELIKLALTEKE